MYICWISYTNCALRLHSLTMVRRILTQECEISCTNASPACIRNIQDSRPRGCCHKVCIVVCRPIVLSYVAGVVVRIFDVKTLGKLVGVHFYKKMQLQQVLCVPACI